MKKSRLRITVDVEFESINEEVTTSIQRQIVSSIEDRINMLIRDGGCDEIGNWTVKSSIEDAAKKTIQTQAERVTPFANIWAYFSTDGPAFVAEIHRNFDTHAESEIMSLTLSDINAALREAYHKYILQLHED